MTRTIFCIKSEIASLIIGYLGCVINGVIFFIATSAFAFHKYDNVVLPVFDISKFAFLWKITTNQCYFIVSTAFHYDDILTYVIIRSVISFAANFFLVVGVIEVKYFFVSLSFVIFI
ncbi:hypothetical protein ACFFRR_008486 [Megaselia abdita]